MTKIKTNTTDSATILRNAMHKMDGDKYQAIREAYYKACEGLIALTEALEDAGLPEGAANDALMIEIELAKHANKTMDKSCLGRFI